MDIQRKPLYNLLRINWQLNPGLKIEPWQVDDYRTLKTEELFFRLAKLNLHLDLVHFTALAENCDTPEELTDSLFAHDIPPIEMQDKVYLIVFELWRRLLPEKPCLSIFCDELDHQINLYDQEILENLEPLQDAIANFQSILDENADRGIKPTEVFNSIISACAHDVETFLYDFISDQIASGNMAYALELIEAFSIYVSDPKWFDLLKVQVASHNDDDTTNELLKDIIKHSASKKDLEFNLELLSLMTKAGNNDLFHQLFKLTLPLVQREEDFQDLLSICSDYYHFLDMDEVEKTIQEILSKRSKNSLELIVDPLDSHRIELKKILQKSAKVEIRSEEEI